MKSLVVPAPLAGGLLFGGSAALAAGPATAQTRLDPRTGKRERIGRAEFGRGHRAGRGDERRFGPRGGHERPGEFHGAERGQFARQGFDDPWFSHGYGFGPGNTGPFDPGFGRSGRGDFFGSD